MKMMALALLFAFLLMPARSFSADEPSFVLAKRLEESVHRLANTNHISTSRLLYYVNNNNKLPHVYSTYDVVIREFANTGDVSKEEWIKLQKSAQKQKSPWSLTFLLDLKPTSRLEYDIRREVVLMNEPFWVPGILRVQKERFYGTWTSLSLYGVTGLDILERATDTSRKILLYAIGEDVQFKNKSSGDIARLGLSKITLVLDQTNSKYNKDFMPIDAALTYHSGRDLEAISKYLNLISNGFQRVSSYYRLARLYEDSGNLALAEKTIHEGLEKYPQKNSILLVAAAKYADKRGSTTEVDRFLTQCLERSPEYPPALIFKAEQEFKKGNINEALKACADTLAFSDGWGEEYYRRVCDVIEGITVKVKTSSDQHQ